jgi:hypothetical protein
MNGCICIIIVLGLLVSISSCKTAEPGKTTVSQTGQGLSDYTLTIRVRDTGGGMFYDVFDQVQRIASSVNLLQIDWSGSYDGPKEIKARLHALPEKMVSVICLRVYSIPNIISVDIDKN